ncbi:DUF2239 family protein [Bordetella petrii]|uniref:DUF2239 family protein n=1 Tax=Bordetella petrii TaxID=94624 RepID=UPI000479C63F|nr:DUF2239 family protein [Bordetella petrii]
MDLPHPTPSNCTAFAGRRLIASGPLPAVAVAVKRALQTDESGPVFIYDDDTGRLVDVDLRGSDDEINARTHTATHAAPHPPAPARGRGRPKLGVVSREVTLLPRHWEWLGAQPGGASVALRKLVEEARRANADTDRQRQRTEAAYRFMLSIAGELPGFEEATRALFAGDAQRFAVHVQGWPEDIRAHATWLAFGERNGAGPA